ncbi:unnamed protein product [Durusdinium trenchii]|uniref:Arylamine N-acetyltransferase n=1 Tax=Durusdinium trenchii TaxID=1381693 RepID=A0ABP0MSQ5_9DINO
MADPGMELCTVRHCKQEGHIFLQRQLEDHLVDAYLERLQLCRCSPSLESLQDLLSAHVDRIAYENLDVQLQRARPPLSFEESVKRVALRGRGGYCFLLVDAFAALLCSLGFQVSLHTANCSDAPEPEAKWGDHVVLVAHLPEGSFVADVGLGEGPRLPFKVEDAEWTEDGFEFKLNGRGGGEWRFDNPVNVPGTLAGMAFAALIQSAKKFCGQRFVAHQKYLSNVKHSWLRIATRKDLMARLGDKIDSSANRALRDLEPTEALSILTDMVNAGDTIRNHSAPLGQFVMSATKRFKDQVQCERSFHGSTVQRAARVQEGPIRVGNGNGCHSDQLADQPIMNC